MLIGLRQIQKLCLVLLGMVCLLFIQGCEKKITHDMSMREAKHSYNQGDHQRSFRITEALAYEGNHHAQYALGYLLYYGIGAPQDKKLGIAWFEQAAKNGNDKAQVALSQLQVELPESTAMNRTVVLPAN